jgi:hypothetical protein
MLLQAYLQPTRGAQRSGPRPQGSSSARTTTLAAAVWQGPEEGQTASSVEGSAACRWRTT